VSPLEVAIVFGAGLGAGAVNAIAGGGTLLSFPTLLWLGRDPIVANASNAVALFPGSLASAWGFRRELARTPRLLWLLLPPSLIGGVLGGVLLLLTPGRTFSALVPWLILAATALNALKRPLTALRPKSATGDGHAGAVTMMLVQLLVAIYGGYFGAAMGIMMLAIFGLFGVDDIHQRNGLKNICAALINLVAGVVFVARGAVDWRDTAVLAAGSIAGGYLGASFGRRLPARVVEVLVVIVGLAAAGAQLFRR
jgi:uncharacterized membrane protein YfcA